MQCLEHSDVESLLSHVSSKAQTRRTRAHYSHLDAVGRILLWDRDITTLALIVGSKALQITDGYGWLVHLQVHATALALFLLWTYTSADSRQGRGVLQYLGGSQELTALYVLDKRRNVDVYRASLHTGRFRTVQTALGLGESHLLGKTDVHLLSTGSGTVYGVKLRHLHTLYGCTLLGFHGGTQCLAPLSVTVGQFCHALVGRLHIHCHVCALFLLGCFHSGEMFLEVFHLLALHILEGSHALEHLVPVYQGTVKLRTIDAHKLGLVTDGESAGTAHTSSVHHDGVERNICRQVVLLCQQTAEFHHDRRTDGEGLIDVFLLDEFLHSYSYHTLLAIAAVVGHDDQLVA